MRAILKSGKKIILNQIDPSERALIDDFFRKSLKQATTIRSLYDIDNELDGISFELTGERPDLINFKTPCIQVIAMKCIVEVDLEVDNETTIEIDPSENDEFLEVELKNKIISIKARKHAELIGTTGQYIVTVTLTKPGFETAIVPINVQVLYFDGNGTYNYEELHFLPKINHQTLMGDKELEELGIQEMVDTITNSQINDLFENM